MSNWHDFFCLSANMESLWSSLIKSQRDYRLCKIYVYDTHAEFVVLHWCLLALGLCELNKHRGYGDMLHAIPQKEMMTLCIRWVLNSWKVGLQSATIVQQWTLFFLMTLLFLQLMLTTDFFSYFNLYLIRKWNPWNKEYLWSALN